MRKLTSFLLISLAGVIESLNTFVRPNVFHDIIELIHETTAAQDAVLLCRGQTLKPPAAQKQGGVVTCSVAGY
jgi:hypothetical protein